jgi:hypothetical protein
MTAHGFQWFLQFPIDSSVLNINSAQEWRLVAHLDQHFGGAWHQAATSCRNSSNRPWVAQLQLG